MFNGDHETACRKWLAECTAWDPDQHDAWYWDYEGPPPPAYGDRGSPMFERPRDDLTHFMLYETTSEGTPLSPAFETLEELCEWAAEHATTFARFKATKEQWREMLDSGLVYAQEGNITFL
jgi:hypothetical protein